MFNPKHGKPVLRFWFLTLTHHISFCSFNSFEVDDFGSEGKKSRSYQFSPTQALVSMRE